MQVELAVAARADALAADGIHARARGIKRRQRQAEFTHVFQRQIVVVRNTRGAGFDVQIVRPRLAHREHPPTNPVLSLEHGDVVTEPGQLIGRDQA